MGLVSVPIESGHIMTFKDALGKPRPALEASISVEISGEAEIAPPTFTRVSAHFDPEADTYRVEGSGDDSQVASSLLHAEQRFEYHLPLRCGATLSVEHVLGGTWQRRSQRAGLLTFVERVTEYRNQAGELVITARTVVVETERPVDHGPEDPKR